MITVPDKITTPANTSTRLVASPVNGRPDPSSVVDTEGAGFSEIVSVVPSVDTDVDTVGSSVVVVSDTTGFSGVVVVSPSPPPFPLFGTYGYGGVVGSGVVVTSVDSDVDTVGSSGVVVVVVVVGSSDVVVVVVEVVLGSSDVVVVVVEVVVGSSDVVVVVVVVVVGSGVVVVVVVGSGVVVGASVVFSFEFMIVFVTD